MVTVGCGGVEHKVGKRGVAMPERKPMARIIAVNPPFVFASVDLKTNPGTDPKSNNVKVTVEGLKGLNGVGRLRQGFLQVRQVNAVPVIQITLQSRLLKSAMRSLIFRISPVDFNGGWSRS